MKEFLQMWLGMWLACGVVGLAIYGVVLLYKVIVQLTNPVVQTIAFIGLGTFIVGFFAAVIIHGDMHEEI